MKKLTFHVVSLPHTQTTKEYSHCAYTEKVRKFCNMMKSLGHTVYLYASEENEANCDELITIASKEDQLKWFGDHDHTKKFFNITWDATDKHWLVTNQRAVAEIKKRSDKKDFVCLIGGTCQKDIADGLPDMMSVEFGIGYSGTFSKYRVFESYAWMHYVYGKQGTNGNFFDTVIPNYCEIEDFPAAHSLEREDYFLFVGRMIKNKGPLIAVETTEAIGAQLLMAGQGVNKQFKDKDGNTHVLADEVRLDGSRLSHIGTVGPEKRGELMSRAKAVFVPTTYVEPFGGVNVEAQLCGTPVITTDWGAFTETVLDHVTGYRVRTLGEAIWAAQNVDKLNRERIRRIAQANYGTERVKFLYQAYFEQLSLLWDQGWYDKDWNAGVSQYERYRKLYN